jgi:hypothetical protein
MSSSWLIPADSTIKMTGWLFDSFLQRSAILYDASSASYTPLLARLIAGRYNASTRRISGSRSTSIMQRKKGKLPKEIMLTLDS